jgi:phospholipid/cholesterol/gamma-HCH transport system substrate-binding protein
MKSSKSKEIKVGLVTIVAIVLLIIGITIGNEFSMSVDVVQITMRFPNSGGIEQTSPVFVNGVKRGKVTNVIPDGGSVLITADIDKINDFREDVTARLGILEITGGKKIEIFPGMSQNEFKKGTVINGITNPDIGDMIALVGDMSVDAKLLLKRLDTIATAASVLINNKKIENTLDNTNQMVESLNLFVNKNIGNLELAVTNLKIVATELKMAIDKYEPKADNLVNKLDMTLDDTRKLLKNTDGAIANANSLINELSDFSKDIKKSDGVVGKLVYDKNFANRLDSTFTNLHDFLLMIKEHGININARLGTRP